MMCQLRYFPTFMFTVMGYLLYSIFLLPTFHPFPDRVCSRRMPGDLPTAMFWRQRDLSLGARVWYLTGVRE